MSAISSSPGVASTPREIWKSIFKYLDYRSLKRIMATCKTWKNIANELLPGSLKKQATDYYFHSDKIEVTFGPDWHTTKKIKIKGPIEKHVVHIFKNRLLLEPSNPFVKFVNMVRSSPLAPTTTFYQVDLNLDDYNPQQIDAIRYFLQEAVAENEKDGEKLPVAVYTTKGNMAWEEFIKHIALSPSKVDSHKLDFGH